MVDRRRVLKALTKSIDKITELSEASSMND